jgi:hypothetical protein
VLALLALLALLAPLSAAHLGGQQPLPARLHPPDAVVYVEVPDFGGLIKAYAGAPMVRFVRDPSGREALGQVLAAVGLDLRQVWLQSAKPLGLSDEEATAWGQDPAQRIAARQDRLRSISLSVSFPDGDRRADGGAAAAARSAGVLAILELDGDVSARAAAQWVAQIAERLQLEPREEGFIDVGESEGRLQVFAGKTEPARSLWSLALGRHVAVAWGTAHAEALAKRWTADGDGQSLAENAEYARLRARLPAQQGATVAQGFCDLDSTLDRLGPDWGTALRPLGSARAWRIELRGDRFVSEFCGAARADSANFFGSSPIPAGLWAFAPADAIALATATLDEHASIRRWALDLLDTGDPAGGDALRELEARYDFDLQRDVIENLGPGLLLYALPIVGLPPSGAAVVEIRDPDVFQNALEGLLARLEDQADQADGGYTLRYRPYKPPDSSDEIPMWIVSFGGIGPLSPTLSILGRHLLVTTTSLRAKREIRRILAGEAPPHPHMAASTLPEGVRLAWYVDWRAVIDGTYTSARGLLSLASIGGAMPVDLKALPADAGALTRFLQPTIFWSRLTPEGSTSRLESSFGPETWIGLALLALGGYPVAMGAWVSGPPGPPGDRPGDD